MRWFFACLALTAYCTASPGPSSLPLLKSKGLGVGVGFSDDSNNATVKSASEKAYADLLSAGLDVIQIAFTWKTLETSPGVYDISTWTGLMKICSETGLAPLVNWPAIDTDVLAVPSDLVDPNDPSRLRPGLNFNSSEVVDRYCSMARALLPPTIAAGGFYVGVGNEVDGYLSSTPLVVQEGFISFLLQARACVQSVEPLLAVGATLTSGALLSSPVAPYIQTLLSSADVVPVTYYPLFPDFTVKSPTVVMTDVPAIISALPSSSAVVFQEFGYPSGYGNANSTDGSSDAKQATFYTSAFEVFAATPTVRVACVFKLDEWSTSQCAAFEQYYNVTEPSFLEYLCTLGLLDTSASPKPAFEVVLEAVQAIRT